MGQDVKWQVTCLGLPMILLGTIRFTLRKTTLQYPTHREYSNPNTVPINDKFVTHTSSCPWSCPFLSLVPAECWPCLKSFQQTIHDTFLCLICIHVHQCFLPHCTICSFLLSLLSGLSCSPHLLLCLSQLHIIYLCLLYIRHTRCNYCFQLLHDITDLWYFALTVNKQIKPQKIYQESILKCLDISEELLQTILLLIKRIELWNICI